jgi:hypothetical protein
MADVVVIDDDDSDSSPTEDAAPDVTPEVADEIAEDVIHELSDIVEDVAEDAAASAAVAAVQEEVAEVVAEAAAVTTEAQFAALHQRLDEMQNQILAIQTPPDIPQEAIVVVDDDAPVELDEFGSADGVISDVEEGVPGTEDGPDEAPGSYKDEVDKRPNRKLGWKALVLGGSGGTGSKRRT